VLQLLHSLRIYRYIVFGNALAGLVFAAAGLFRIAAASADATVNYQGYLSQSPLGGPVAGGFVVAGTFAPGFNPSTYFDVFGDEYGNVALNHYSNAVAAGVFRPIGSPVTTSVAGFFNGSGSTIALEGTSVYLFAFARHPDFGDPEGVIASGSSPPFKVLAPAGSTSIDAALADDFVFGLHAPDGALALGMLPIPKPNACALSAIGAATFGAFRSARRDERRRRGFGRGPAIRLAMPPKRTPS